MFLNVVHSLNVVQLSSVPDPEPAPDLGSLGARERNRLTRHRSYVGAALGLVFAEGLGALTMQRLADEVGASVGSVYTYFPSKGALVAEVQREAIERLAASALVLGHDLDQVLLGQDDDGALLAPVLAFGRFWLTAADEFPEEMQLLLLLLSDVSDTVPAEEGGRVVPSALRLLGLAEERLARAADAGALDAGDSWSRTISLGASLTGCVQLAVVERWDPDLLSPRTTGRAVLDALLLGWGAGSDALAGAHAVVDDLEAASPLPRPVPEGRPS